LEVFEWNGKEGFEGGDVGGLGGVTCVCAHVFAHAYIYIYMCACAHVHMCPSSILPTSSSFRKQSNSLFPSFDSFLRSSLLPPLPPSFGPLYLVFFLSSFLCLRFIKVEPLHFLIGG
jgi:hypothetical protein